MVKIGVLKKNKYIQSVLVQSGFAYELYDNEDELYQSKCKCIFPDNIRKVTDKTIITNHRKHSEAYGHTVVHKRAYYYKIVDCEHILRNRSFYFNEFIYTLPNNDNLIGCLYDINNDKIKGSGLLIDGNIISFPWDFESLLLGNEKMGKRPYYSPVVRKHWVDVGPNVDYGALRRLLEEIFTYIFKESLTRYKRFKDMDRYLFAFRVDADGYSETSTKKMLHIINETGIRFSWFIDCESWRKHSNDVKHLFELNQEIGIHCWHHMTYSHFSLNFINIFLAKLWLKKFHRNIQGSCAPFGYYNSNYEKACCSNNIKYSSEFVYDVDDLPLEISQGRWQIPIHTGCIGILRAYGFTKEEIFRHLQYIIDKNIADNGMVIIYGHPVERMEMYEQEIIRLININKNRNIDFVTVSEILSKWEETISSSKEILSQPVVNYRQAEDVDTFEYPNELIRGEASMEIKYKAEMSIGLVRYIAEGLYRIVRNV